MFARFLSAHLLLIAAGWIYAGARGGHIEHGRLYDIRENQRENQQERSFSFNAPLQVRYNFDAPVIEDYKVNLTVTVSSREGRQAEARLTFSEAGTFKPAIRPRLPHSSHVEFVLSESKSVELPLTGVAHSRGGLEEVNHRGATVPLDIFKELVAAKSVRGQLYWQSSGEDIRIRNDLRSFTLDAKTLRTLAALDAKTQ